MGALRVKKIGGTEAISENVISSEYFLLTSIIQFFFIYI